MLLYGGIGEVVNTPDCGSGIQGFDSLMSPHFKSSRTFWFFYMKKPWYFNRKLRFFCYIKERFDSMKYKIEEMKLNEKLYKMISNICYFDNITLEVKKGIVFKVESTNINFIEPHRFKDIVLVLLCYDNLNLYLYNREIPINTAILRELIERNTR